MAAEPGTRGVHSAGVLAVLVVYGLHYRGSAAWSWLVANAGTAEDSEANTSGVRLRVRHLLVYDNSAHAAVAQPMNPQHFSYVHDPNNGGTAAAYREAARLATAIDIPWLLLLDQDTSLPADFLCRASESLAGPQAAGTIAAMVPWVRHKNRMISPARITRTGSIAPLNPNQCDRSGRRLTAIASGAFVRTSALMRLPPTPPELWLDYVDHWLFACLQAATARVVLIDCALQHDLSIASPERLRSDRLHNILVAESRFVASLPWLARFVHPWRLLARAASMWHNNHGHALMIGRHAIGFSPASVPKSRTAR